MTLRYKLLKGGVDDFDGAHHEDTHAFVHNKNGWVTFTNNPKTINKDLFTLLAHREPIANEQDLSDCIGATEADAKRGGFIASTKSFVGDFLPEGYPIFGHTNCRCKPVKVGEARIDGKWHEAELANKYLHEIKPGVFVDVYDVLMAWNVTNPALQHLIKKALQPGNRGHKSHEQDLQDIIDSAIRAKELEIK
mgnify:CR=1 FL=1|jgi:hypothetical protein